MTTTLCIFEDELTVNFQPLTYTRPIYELLCGILTLREKIEQNYPGAEKVLFCRKFLEGSVKKRFSDLKVNKLPADSSSVLFINGRIIADSKLSDLIQLEGEDALFICDGVLIAARLSGENLRKLDDQDIPNREMLKGVREVEITISSVKYIWDLVSLNGEQIVSDFNRLVNSDGQMNLGKIYPGVNLINESKIFIGRNSKIKPGAVLDAEEGPIYIGENVTIFPNVFIEGPCFIGDNSKIKTGAKIYEGTSIGPVCKVGGEVEESIIHSYSNKQHDGFLGHAYLGSWVNLGADTNNSDLKNNYGNVKVFINDEEINSGSMFVGLTMGDHSKSGINTMFNTGSVVGVCANVFGADFPPKYIPSFSWGGSGSLVTYKIEKAIEVAKRVTERRNIEFSSEDGNLFAKIFDLTSHERKKRKME